MNRSIPLFALGAALSVACGTQLPAAVATTIGAPATVAAGTSFSATVAVVDATGKVVTGFVGGVALTSSDASAQLPAQYVFTAADHGTHVFSVELRTAGTQSLTATAPSLPTAGKTQLLVTAGPAASFALTAPATAISGAPFDAVLTASDAFHNLATGYAGTVALTSNDAHAQLPAAYTFTAADAGSHTFSVSLEEDGVSTLTATDSATATLTASATITVGSGAAAALQITGLAANSVAGVEQALTITAYDAAGNVAAGYLGTVTLTTTDGQAVLAPPYTFTAADQGVHPFSAAVAFHQAGAQTVTGSDGTLTATAQTQVGSAGASSLQLALPSTEVAGVALDATVTALDAFGNLATGYLGQVAFAGGGAQASLPAAASFTAGDAGVHHFPAMVTLRTAGTQTVSVADAQNAQLTASSPVLVSPAAAASIHLSGLPSTTVAGVAQSGAVTALDAFGNIAIGYLGTVNFSSTDAQALLPASTTFLAADAGMHAFASGFTLRTAGAQTITAADGAGLSAQATLTVTPAAAASLTLTLPQTEVAGVAVDASVTAFDAFGNIATGYLGTIQFSSSDAAGILPANYAFISGDAGVHAFPAQVTLRTAGSQSVSVTDSQNSALTASTQVAVSPAAAASLQLTGLPQTAVAGVALSGTVIAFDAFGNIATGYLGQISFTSTDPQATLPAATAFTADDSGTHAFASGFALRTAGSRTIQVTDGAGLTAQSSVLVTPAAAATLVIGDLPAVTISLHPADFNLTLLDPFGNIATGYLGTIHFTSTDAQAVLPADYTFVAGDTGAHSFPGGATFAVAGTQMLTATDAVNAGITGSASTLVGAGGVVALQMTGLPDTVVAGALQKVTVTALDKANNIVIGYLGSVAFSSTDGKAVFAASYQYVPGDAGAHSFDVAFGAAGTQTLSVTDGQASGQQSTLVLPGAAVSFAVAGLADPETAGVAQGATITALDAFGNIAAGYLGTIAFTSTDPLATLPANYSFVAGDEGVHAFPGEVVLRTDAQETLTATDLDDATITGAQRVLVAPAAASGLVVAGFPSPQVAGVAASFSVTAEDTFGNIATGYRGNIKFTSSDASAVLPANYSFISGDAGLHTFPATLKTVSANASLTATDTATSSITGEEEPIAVTPAAAASLVVAGFPASQVAGVAGAFTVTAKDAYGNIATGYRGTVKFSSSDSSGVLPGNYAFLSGDAGAHSFSATLKTTNTAASLSATDTATSGISGTQSPIAITPAAAASLVVAGFPTSQVAGVAGSFIVTAKDAFGNIATGYTGTVKITSSDAAAVVPANYLFISGDAGVRSFSATLKTVASGASITATDTVTATITGKESPIAITAAPAASFTVAGFPASQVAGVAGSFTVTAKDSYGNIATGYLGSVKFSSSDGAAALPGNYSFLSADAGTHSFSATLKTVATNASLTATDTVTASITGAESPIAITPAAATTLLVAGFPSSQIAGVAGSFTVTAKDPYGNTATGYLGTVKLSSSDAAAVLAGNYPFISADAGVHSFIATLKTVATAASLTATDAATAAITGTESPIAITPATATVLVVAGFPATKVAGVAGSFSVTAKDPYGNIATGYLGTVHFTSSDGASVLPGNYAFISGDAGVHSFSATLKTVTSNASITGTDTITSTITGTDSPIAITPAAASTLVVAGFPASQIAGIAGSFTVTAKDLYGNIATGYAGTIAFTSSDALGVLPASYSFISGDSGAHTFSATLKTVAAAASISATDTVTSSITGSDSPIAIAPAGAATLVVAGFTTPQIAGTAGSFTVTARDPYGNIATGYLGTVHFTSSDSAAVLSGNYAFISTDAGVHSFSATLKTVTTLASLTATDTVTATITGTQSPIVIKPASASVLVVAGFPATEVAGVAGSFSVTAKDPYGNIATGYLGTVHFTSSDGASVLPGNYAFISGDAGVHSFSATLKTVTSNASITGTDTITSTITGTDSPIAITPAAASTLVVAGFPASQIAGTAGSFTVTAKDLYGNIATGYAGTIAFTSSDALGVLPASYSFISGDSGAHTFSATLKTVAAAASISATDTVTSSITGSDSPIAIAPAGAATLVVGGFTTPQIAGTAGSFTVTARDPYGNIATGYLGTAHFTSSDSAAVLSGNYAFISTDAGVHSFSATLKTVTTLASLTATDMATATITGTQSPIVIKPASASVLVVAGFPATEAAGTASTFTVTAKDPYGNIATGYLGTVHFTSSDAVAVLPADYHYVAGDSGAHTFSATLKTVATNASITATDKTTATITGTESPIDITPASGTILVVSGFPSSETAGVSGSFSVTAMDAFGNVAKGYLGTVHFTSSDAAAVLPANYTFISTNQGTATFSATLKTVASDTSLTATDTSSSSIAGTQAPIAITPAAASALVVAGFPSPQIAGAAGSFSVTAKDPYGNIATGYLGTVHFVSSDGQGVLPGDYPFAAADQGQQTFNATLKTVSLSASLTATDTLSASINGTDSPIAITPAIAKTLAVTGFPASVVAGTSSSFTVTAKDAYGNIATGYSGTIKLTSSDAAAVLPANYTFLSADAGARSFSATLKTVATAASLTATDTVTSTITGAESPIAVTPAAASLLVVAGFPASVVAGTANGFTVTAKDPYGNIVTGYLGSIKITSSDAAGVLPANYTFVSGDNGVHSLSATLKTAALSASLTATDTATSTITGTESPILVAPAGASLLVVAGFPTPSVAGTPGSFSVTAKDTYGNIATGYVGTIRFSSTDAAATIPATYTFLSGDAGVRSFSATLVTVTTTGSITATDTVTAITGSQTSITISPAPAKTLAVAGFPASVVAGASNSFTVTAKDQYGNTATGYTGTIKLTSSDQAAVLPANYTFLSTDSGVRSFSATLKTAPASASLTATDTATSSITGTESPISVSPAAASLLTVTAFPASVVAGTANGFTVTAKDPYGNIATGYLGTIKLTSSDPAAVLPANYTFLSTDAGVRGFSATLKSVASATSLTATDTATSTITGSESPIAVTPANASILVVAGFPTPSVAGTAGSFTVTAKDPFGNIATGYRGTVAFTSNDGASTVLPANYSFAAGDAGARVFSATLKTVISAGSITATDTATSTITGTQSPIAINPAAATALTLAGFPSPQVAGVAGSFTVTALDSFGNIATGYLGTVRFSSSDPAASLPGTYTFTPTDSGVHAASATLTTVTTAGTLTATDTSSSIAGTQSSIHITPAAASRLLVAGFPSAQIAGTAGSLTVTAKDPYGNVVTGYLGTVHFTSTDGQGVLPGNYTFVSTDAGARSFSATLKTANPSASITATDTSSGINGAQSPINVTPAAASNLAYVSGSGQTGSANTVLQSPLQAIVTDPYSNPISGYTVTWSVKPGSAGNYGNANTLGETTSTAANGIATTSPAPTVGVTPATDTFLANAVNTTTGAALIGSPVSYTETSTAGPIYSFNLTSTAGAPQTPGVSFNVTATALDQYGNVITSYLGPASGSTSDPKGTVPSSISFAGGNGVQTFAATLDTASSETITVSDSSVTPTATGSSTIRVGPPVSISPPSLTTVVGHSATFTASGGSGIGLAFTLGASGSGTASVTPAGLYTAGANPGTDSVTATDSLGNKAVATITVNNHVAFATNTLSVSPRGTATLQAVGGVPPYTFSYASNGDQSGGSISAAGAYVGGAPDHSPQHAWLGELLDQMQVTDSIGDYAFMPLKVTPGPVIAPWGITVSGGDSYCFSNRFGSFGMQPYGGSGSGYSFTINSNSSGSSINATTGCYTAGTANLSSTGHTTDYLRLTDSLGNFYPQLQVNITTVDSGFHMIPATAGIGPLGDIDMVQVHGGGGAYTYGIETNSSGGTLDAPNPFFGGAYFWHAGNNGGVSTTESDELYVSDASCRSGFCFDGYLQAQVLPGPRVYPWFAELYDGDSITYFATGGAFASYSYSLSTNSSGGSINSTSGTYVAGNASGTVEDVVQISDAVGATSTSGLYTLGANSAFHASPYYAEIPLSSTFVVQGVGGKPPYSFTTNAGTIDATSGFFRDSVSGTATVTVKDAANNSSTATIYVAGGITISPSNPETFGGIFLTASGGVGADFEWSSSSGWIDRHTGFFECGGGGSATVSVSDFYGNSASTTVNCEIIQ